MSSLVPLLAHLGVGQNPWFGVATVSSLVLAVILVLVIAKVLTVKAPGDLLLPLAVVVLIAGLAGTLGDAINDQGPWAVPLGVVALVVLLVVAFRGEESPVVWRGPSIAAVGVAGLLAVLALMPVIEYWWFGDGTDGEFEWAGVTWYWEDGYGESAQEVRLPARGDAVLTAELVSGPDDAGVFTIRVTVEGGTLGDGTVAERPADPETELWARFDVGPVFLTPPVPDDCVAADPCTTADFEMTLPPGFQADPPEKVVVHLYTADRLPFSPPLSADVELFPAG